MPESVDELVVTWSTWNDTNESIVKYGINGPILKALGTSTLFVDGGELRHSQYIHRVKLTGLQPSSKYGNYQYMKKKNLFNLLMFLFEFSILLWK